MIFNTKLLPNCKFQSNNLKKIHEHDNVTQVLTNEIVFFILSFYERNSCNGFSLNTHP